MNVSISQSSDPPSFPIEILDLILKEFNNDKRSLARASGTCRLFRALVRPYLFHSIVITTMGGLYELPYFGREVLGSIRVLELAFRSTEDLQSSPWIGSPLAHLLLALSRLTNIEELVPEDLVSITTPDEARRFRWGSKPKGYPYVTLQPLLLFAVQSHSTLHILRSKFFVDETEWWDVHDFLEVLPTCPRPSSRVPLLLPSIVLVDPYPLDRQYFRTLNFIHRQGMHVETLVIPVSPHSLVATRTATSLVEKSVPSLSTVFLQPTITGDETPPHPSIQIPHFFPRLLARNPSIRTISPRCYGDVPVFSSGVWKSLIEIPGLEQLANPSIEGLWLPSTFDDGDTSFSIGISEEEMYEDGSGGRSLVRLRAVGVGGFERREAGRHGSLDVGALAQLASLFPSLEYLDLRDPAFGGEDPELFPSLFTCSISFSSRLRPVSLTHGLTVILLAASFQVIAPNLLLVDLPSHCPRHRDLSSSPSIGNAPQSFLEEVLSDFEAAGGPFELWKHSSLPRLTSQIEELADAIPTLEIVQRRTSQILNG